jgi:thiol-disulfide isomerase/thioredoxin
MKLFFQSTKAIVTALLLVGFLQLTGLWQGASVSAQKLALKTGLLNADGETKKAPLVFDYNFTIKDLKGNKIAFDQYKGKVIFINLWATWCGPCKAEMPGIQELAASLKGKPIEFVMLSLDKDAMLPKVISYIEKNQYTFPVFMPHEFLPDQLQVASIPTTLIVSKEGKIIVREVGAKNYNTKKMIDFLTTQSLK